MASGARRAIRLQEAFLTSQSKKSLGAQPSSSTCIICLFPEDFFGQIFVAFHFQKRSYFFHWTPFVLIWTRRSPPQILTPLDLAVLVFWYQDLAETFVSRRFLFLFASWWNLRKKFLAVAKTNSHALSNLQHTCVRLTELQVCSTDTQIQGLQAFTQFHRLPACPGPWKWQLPRKKLPTARAHLQMLQN